MYVFTLVEMVTHKNIAIKISRRTTKATTQLRRLYGKRFSVVFKSITADNGAEFQDFNKYEERYETKIYFAHPFSSCEHPQNERLNEMLRQYLQKGKSVDEYSADEILRIADKMNTRPRKSLGYYRPDELFDAFLDKVYTTDIVA